MTEIPSNRFVQLSTGQPGLRTTLHTEVRDASENSCNSCLDFISSDESLDRYNEVISAAGWQLQNYRRNPVFQNAHQTGDILHTIGKALITEVRRTGVPSPGGPHSAERSQELGHLSGGGVGNSLGKGEGGLSLFQRIEFACDVNPMARIAYGLYRGKFLNAVSVGFVPIRWKDGSSSLSAGGEGRGEVDSFSASAPSSSSPARRIFLEQELLEVSAVAIPANPHALALGLKSGAIEKSDLKDTLDLFRSALGGRDDFHVVPKQNELISLALDLRNLLRST